MTIDDIAARLDGWLPCAGNCAGAEHRTDCPAHYQKDVVAEIAKLTAALADAEARGRLVGLEEAAKVADKHDLIIPKEWDSITRLNNSYAITKVLQAREIAKAIRALAQSPEDGKQS